jgi:hypothetical protein
MISPSGKHRRDVAKPTASHYVSAISPDNGGSKHIRNFGKMQSDYMEQRPRREPSSLFLTTLKYLSYPELFGPGNIYKLDSSLFFGLGLLHQKKVEAIILSKQKLMKYTI